MSGYPNYWRPGCVSKFMTYVPYWFKKAKADWNNIRDDLRVSGIILQYLLHANPFIKDMCAVMLHTINKRVPQFIKYGVRLY